jgi:hypothetical protein
VSISSILKPRTQILYRQGRSVSYFWTNPNGTGKIINNEKEIGGWPTYASGEPPVRALNDGIPEEWKKARGLPLNDPNVANAINADGYTQLEMYLNSLVNP